MMNTLTPKPKSLEIFCGTGGVGKTTLSTARAMYLASQKRKVLIITLDPSERLKDFLHIREEEIGMVKEVSPYLYAQVIKPENLLSKTHLNIQNENRILNTLLGPYGGMNEIYGLLEVYHHYQQKSYDTIILDTAPGKHFLDFIESAKKIRLFFENSFLIFFHQLKSQLEQIQQKKTSFQKVISKIMETGVKKLMEQLEKVTGISFVQEFIETIDILYVHRETFLKALEMQSILTKKEISNWFLVTAADYDAQESADIFHQKAKSFFHQDSYFILNRAQEKIWQNITGLEEPWLSIRDRLLEQERLNILKARKTFENVLSFSLLDNVQIDAQLQSLMQEWRVYGEV